MRQQIITFEEMYDFVKDDGVYLCEDLHTSYWKSFGGGYAKTGGGGEIPHSLNTPNILLML